MPYFTLVFLVNAAVDSMTTEDVHLFTNGTSLSSPLRGDRRDDRRDRPY